MLHPQFHDAAQTLCRVSSGTHVEHGIEALVAHPIEHGVIDIEHFQLELTRRGIGLSEQATDATETTTGLIHLDRFGVCQKNRSILQADALTAEEKLGAAHRNRVVGAVE